MRPIIKNQPMHLKTIATIIASIFCTIIKAQNISGYVVDAKSNEVLISASIYSPESNTAVLSNDYGFFSLKQEDNITFLLVSFIGYHTDTIYLQEYKNNSNIALQPKSVELQEFEVSTGTSWQLVEGNEYAARSLTIESIEKLPIMFGEADIVKAVQLQPGVKTLGDGSSGMFVRGGSDDQNLILIDEAPVYNPSHMFGLISVFNPDAINNVSFYKSNMPAEYGGRCSAVLDAKMKEGNKQEHRFSVGLSLLSASLYANGPIVKEKSSYLISLRKSPIDLIVNPMIGDGLLSIIPGFYDINVKVNTKIGEKDHLFLSFYHGKDKVQAYKMFNNNWSNTVGTLRWNRALGQQWYSNLSLIGSSYNNDVDYTYNKEDGYYWETAVDDINLKYELTNYISSDNQLKLGINSIYHQFTPGRSNDIKNSIPSSNAMELGAYAQHDVTLWDKLGINYGLRLSSFLNMGKTVWYEYLSDGFVVTNINDGGVYNSEFQLEPRVSFSYKIDTDKSLKLAYARNAQYMQVLNNSSSAYATLETWFPANKNIKPLLSDVVSLGWFHQITPMYFISAELYYKNLNNVIDYVDHAVLTDNPYVERETLSGKGKSYGAEVEFSKQSGRLTGSVSYSYSRALQTISGINDGNEYSVLYDMPHDIRIQANYAINKSWNVGAFWVYTTGRPTTIPIGFYGFGGGWYDSLPIYSDRNAARFPDYHRLDLSVNYSTKPKEKKHYWDFGFGVNNVYNRMNLVGYGFGSFGDNVIEPYSILPILPNFSIKFTY